MSAVDDIYDALTDDEAFEALPVRLANVVGARSATLQTFGADGSFLSITTSYFTDEMAQFYVDNEFHRYDLWRAPASRPETINTLQLMDDIISKERVQRSIFFNEFYRRFGDDTGRCLGGVMSFRGGLAGLGLHRSVGAEPFSAEDLKRVQPMVVHLQRLCEVRTALSHATTRALLAEGGLNAQARAIFITNGHGRVLMMNTAAEALATTGDAFCLRGGAIQAVQDDANALLAAAIGSAAARRGASGGAFAAPSPLRRTPLRTVVSPVSIGGATRVLVVVDDAETQDGALHLKLKGMFGLTAAEAATVAALVEGQSPAEIAEARGVGLATVRTQIQISLRKMDARGITELVRLAVTLP